MLVPDRVKKCVAFIGIRKVDGSYSVKGTAFFLIRQLNDFHSFLYFVTAKHNIENVKNLGLTHLSVRLNLKQGGSEWFDIPISDWHYHPKDSEESYIDVAVMRITGEMDDLDILGYPLVNLATAETIKAKEIGEGDEVFIAGLFHPHHGKKKNTPIIRIGNIAATPEELVDTRVGEMEAYLIEARSIGGLSGSPVFVNLGTTRYANKFGFQQYNYHLLGLIHGHFDTELDLDDTETAFTKAEKVNMGIAITVPSTKILETINQPMIKEMENEIEENVRKQHLPTMDSFEDESFTKELFTDVLKRASRKTFEPAPKTKETSE